MPFPDCLEKSDADVTVAKPALLVIGATYSISSNRRKLCALADYFDITCATSKLSDRSFYGLPIQEFEDINSQEPFLLRRLAEFPKGKEFTQFFYSGLHNAFREKEFDFVLVDSEPWGLVKWQAWLLAKLYQRKALFGEFSWENVKREGFKGQILSVIYRLSILADDFIIAGNQTCRAYFWHTEPILNAISWLLRSESTPSYFTRSTRVRSANADAAWAYLKT
ncbi:MAG: hypothetical protein JO232_07995, partial [Verrucomicrobia bacterium]|nr:hypothetical protein [Verrucomicrobiota bacterium]